MLKAEPPYDSNFISGYVSKGNKIIVKERYLCPGFSAVLCKIAKTWKEFKGLLKDGWVKKIRKIQMSMGGIDKDIDEYFFRHKMKETLTGDSMDEL